MIPHGGMGRAYSYTAFDGTGTALLTSFVYGQTIYPAQSQYRALELALRVTPDPTTTGLTGFTVSVEARDSDDDAWQQLQTIDENNANQDKQQAYTSMPGGTSAVNYGPLSIDPTGKGQIRVGVKIAGAPKAGDRVTANAKAVQDLSR